MSGIYVAVGIPGCGKSTYAERLLTNGTIDVVVSSDKIREQLTGDATDQTRNNNVFDVLHGRVRAALSVGLDVLVDATNLRPRDRQRLLNYTQDGDVALALRFSDSENFLLCQQRNKGRERVVPDDVMERFHRTFLQDCNVETLLAEGWKVVSV